MYSAGSGGALRGKCRKTSEPAYADATAWQAGLPAFGRRGDLRRSRPGCHGANFLREGNERYRKALFAASAAADALQVRRYAFWLIGDADSERHRRNSAAKLPWHATAGTREFLSQVPALTVRVSRYELRTGRWCRTRSRRRCFPQ